MAALPRRNGQTEAHAGAAGAAVPEGNPQITFNRPYATGREFDYVQEAIDNLHLSGNGPFAGRCAAWLEERIGCAKALLTFSGTSALEMAALLADIRPGDEIVMPSFTFVSTATAFVLRGAVPVFVEIRPDTLNLDEEAIDAALTPRTKAIVPVHYAGTACEMDTIMSLAAEHDLLVIEDAAQGVMSRYRDRPLGGIGQLGCVSFHETKNVMCGEGGALLVNEPEWVERAEIVQEKGTNRNQFFRGQVDKYTWVDLGSSFLTSEINGAFLWAQLESADEITQTRMELWDTYHRAFADLDARERVRRPIVPAHCRHNAHMYYLLLPDRRRRDLLIERLAGLGIQAVFHYVPLHSSPAGRRYGRTAGPLPITDSASERLVRLPLWVEMGQAETDRVVEGVEAALA
jgi:dTDP-4-amino-4,6-dideoxygalactose transaminase